jgi:hypothetical protein
VRASELLGKKREISDSTTFKASKICNGAKLVVNNQLYQTGLYANFIPQTVDGYWEITLSAQELLGNNDSVTCNILTHTGGSWTNGIEFVVARKSQQDTVLNAPTDTIISPE